MDQHPPHPPAAITLPNYLYIFPF